MESKNFPKARDHELVVQELKDELLIYDLSVNKAYCLNETAGLVFTLCDGQRSVSEISQLMSRKVKTPVVEDLVLLALNDLKKNGLLENAEPDEASLPNGTRREIIKRAGLASMIALPLVSSIIAPNAAMAASVLPAGSPCTTNEQCSLVCRRSCAGETVGSCPIGSSCQIQGFCSGSGVCSTGGPCDDHGQVCIGANGQTGVCTFTGVCRSGGAIGGACFNNGRPCGIFGTCVGTCIS